MIPVRTRARAALTHLYASSIFPTLSARPAGNEPSFPEFARSLGTPEAVVVVASGPSSRDLRPVDGHLHIATNASYRVVADVPFVYFVADGYHLHRYIKLGVRGRGWRGTVFRFETSGSASAATLAGAVEQYKAHHRRAQPEVLLSDARPDGPYRDNFETLERHAAEHLGVKVKQFNSGFGALYVGFYLASILGVPLRAYGLDAGEGGHVHFDGSPMSAPSVVGDRVRSRLSELLAAIGAQSTVPFENLSYFRGDH